MIIVGIWLVLDERIISHQNKFLELNSVGKIQTA